MTAYYNERDKFAAAWLRKLIKAGHIALGEVDERSIIDVRPSDIAGYTQCHFFAGIGAWSYAIRRAGWPDDRPVWTGSCPCQSFSAAGKGAGFADERHLWPSWYWLIEQCRPDVIFGEQVEAAIRHSWLDLVQTDLEGIHYAFAAFGLPAAGFGAPHIRQRLYFVADAGHGNEHHGRQLGATPEGNQGTSAERQRVRVDSRDGEHTSALAHTHRSERRAYTERGTDDQHEVEGREQGASGSGERGEPVELGHPTNGFWSNAEWIACRDGKARPVEPGVAPLVDGSPNRVGRLRGYGNAICAPVAEEFIRAYLA